MSTYMDVFVPKAMWTLPCHPPTLSDIRERESEDKDLYCGAAFQFNLQLLEFIVRFPCQDHSLTWTSPATVNVTFQLDHYPRNNYGKLFKSLEVGPFASWWVVAAPGVAAFLGVWSLWLWLLRATDFSGLAWGPHVFISALWASDQDKKRILTCCRVIYK